MYVSKMENGTKMTVQYELYVPKKTLVTVFNQV